MNACCAPRGRSFPAVRRWATRRAAARPATKKPDALRCEIALPRHKRRGGRFAGRVVERTRTGVPMPTYEYRCAACNHEFEQFQSIKAGPLKKCPKCGK